MSEQQDCEHVEGGGGHCQKCGEDVETLRLTAEIDRLRAWIKFWRRDGIDEGYSEENSPYLNAALRGDPSPLEDT